MEELEGKTWREWLGDNLLQLRQWLKPVAGDALWLTIIKTIFKSIALLILLALSPAIIIILSFVFFAAL